MSTFPMTGYHLQFPLSLVSKLTPRVDILTVLKLYGWAIPGKNDPSISYSRMAPGLFDLFTTNEIVFKYHTCCWHCNWYMKAITVTTCLYIVINLWLSTVSDFIASRDLIFQMTQLVKVILGCWRINCWESTSDFLITGSEPKRKKKEKEKEKRKRTEKKNTDLDNENWSKHKNGTPEWNSKN